MAGIPGCAPRRYTQEEKVALVTEIERQLRAGTRSLWEIARELGTTGTSYQAWRKAGIGPLAEPKNHPARRIFSQAQREEFLAEVDRRREQGESVESACRALGISDKTYRVWRAKASPMRPVEIITALVPVQAQASAVIQPPAPRTLTLIAPGGYRIEGLGTESAAAILRALT